jgi:hypothetical protein
MSESLNDCGDRQDPKQWLAKEAEVRSRRFYRRARGEPRSDTCRPGTCRDDDTGGPSDDSRFKAEPFETLCGDRWKDCSEEPTHSISSRVLAVALKYECPLHIHDTICKALLLVKPVGHVVDCRSEEHPCTNSIERSKADD